MKNTFTLLVERFKLTIHHEQKMMPVFALVAGKNGPKMTTRRERFHWLVAPRSTVVQVSPVHAGVCESPENTLVELFRRVVLPMPSSTTSNAVQ